MVPNAKELNLNILYQKIESQLSLVMLKIVKNVQQKINVVDVEDHLSLVVINQHVKNQLNVSYQIVEDVRLIMLKNVNIVIEDIFLILMVIVNNVVIIVCFVLVKNVDNVKEASFLMEWNV